MPGNCSDRPPCRRARQRGFTLPELVAVIILVGVLSAVAMPKMQGALGLRDDAWHDEVIAALRLARQTAVSHRRVVCASVSGANVSLSIAPTNPATGCTATLAGPDGGGSYATAPSGSTATLSPAGVLYFQPTGRVTTDLAGGSAADRTIAFSGTPDAVTIVGETGHVR